MTKKPAPAPAKKPFFSARAVGSFVPGLTRKAFEKYGFSAATLITDWAAIVGHELARQTSPEKLKWPRQPEIADTDGAQTPKTPKTRQGATLFMRVEGSRALEIEYQRAQIAERVNAYFGYRAVADIRIVQAPLPKPKAPRVARVTPADKVALPSVQDENLRAALEKLGAGIRAKKRTADKA